MRSYNTASDFYTHNNNYRPLSPIQTSYNNNHISQQEKSLNSNTYTGVQFYPSYQEQAKRMNSSNGYDVYVNQAKTIASQSH
jgi:hypothetical protein